MSTEQRVHHPFSASQISSLRACPSYIGVQSETPHPRTLIGTKGHAVIESGLDDPTLDDEVVEQATQCMAFYQERLAAIGPGATELSEVYLSIDEYDTSGGFLDAAIISATGDYAELVDFKLGLWPVPPAAENGQIKTYVLGLFRAYPTVKTIKAFIVQPPADFISEAVFHREQVEELHKEIWAIVARAKAARAAGDFKTATPYYPNCNFCALVGTCPAVATLAGKVGAKFAPLLVPDNITPHKILDPKDARAGWQVAAVVEAWAKAFRAEITDRVLRKETPPPDGYKLVSRSKREIADIAKYKEITLRLLTADEWEATLKPSMTAVEAKISEKAPRGAKTKTVEAFAEELDAAGATVPGEASVFLKAVPQKPKSDS